MIRRIHFLGPGGEDCRLVLGAPVNHEESGFERVSPAAARWLTRFTAHAPGDALADPGMSREATVWRRVIPSLRMDTILAGSAVSLGDLAMAEPIEPSAFWAEVMVMDAEDQPVQHVECEVRLPGGSVKRGRTNDAGVLRIEGIANAGECEISFPRLDEAAVEAL